MAGIFKAYDVRGIYPREIDEGIARRIGQAFRAVLDSDDLDAGPRVVVSRDMRPSSEPLAAALIDGLREIGLDVLDVGLATTPMNYFAIGHLRAAGGIQVTASHNPAEYNGLKFSKRDARPVSGDHGIPLLEATVAAVNGLGTERALAAITRDAAKLLGVDDRVGTLEPGKDADVVVFDGDPFEYTSHVCTVLIDGRPVSETCR